MNRGNRGCCSAFDAIELLAEASQFARAVPSGPVALVGEIVRLARKGVDQFDRAPNLAGSNTEATGKFS